MLEDRALGIKLKAVDIEECRYFGENTSSRSYDLSRTEVTNATGFTGKRQGRLLGQTRDLNEQQSSVLPDDVSQHPRKIRTCALRMTGKLSCRYIEKFYLTGYPFKWRGKVDQSRNI